MSTNDRKLDIIYAGTFGAPVREWVPGYPRQYNLLKIEDNQLKVYTRRREERWIIMPLSCDDITGELYKHSDPILPLLQRRQI